MLCCGNDRRLSIRFLMNPIRFEEDASRPGHVGAVVFERTRLEGPPGQQVAVGTGHTETIKASLVLKSIGYKSLAVRILA
jgi:3,4-dihydroxy-2-butanone 4-phosphate synthase